MKTLKNENGVALVTSLLLTLLALAIIMALLYMVTWQSRLSAAHKTYRTAIEASQGGAEIVTKQLIPFVFANNSTVSATAGSLAGQFNDINLVTGSSPCLTAKITTGTAQWGLKCTTADNNPANANFYDPTKTPDFTFTLKGTDPNDPNNHSANDPKFNFTVYTKIVDTVPGNSDSSGFDLLDSGAGVAGTSSGVAPKHMPAIYRIEIQGQRQVNAQEKAKLSVLYAY